jgi:hypothetical protein
VAFFGISVVFSPATTIFVVVVEFIYVVDLCCVPVVIACAVDVGMISAYGVFGGGGCDDLIAIGIWVYRRSWSESLCNDWGE